MNTIAKVLKIEIELKRLLCIKSLLINCYWNFLRTIAFDFH